MSTPVSPSLTTPLPEAATVERWREDFPILHRRVYGKPLIYLDNAATAQKPRQVIEALTDFYENRNATGDSGGLPFGVLVLLEAYRVTRIGGGAL